jgi:plasmid maintenance system antidote protein VapI
MFNRNLLRSKIVENGLTYSSLASAIDLSESSLSKRINGTVDFTLEDMVKIKDALKLSSDELMAIFFNK